MCPTRPLKRPTQCVQTTGRMRALNGDLAHAFHAALRYDPYLARLPDRRAGGQDVTVGMRTLVTCVCAMLVLC
jgi:hypothetical protein